MIEVNNLTRSSINEALLRKAAKIVLAGEKKQNQEISIALVPPKRAKELNRLYRKRDVPANVLSFPFEGVLGLGEIVLCPAQIKRDAKKYGMIFEQALAWMLIHGILHLLSYDHIKRGDAKRMKQKEHMYLSCI